MQQLIMSVVIMYLVVGTAALWYRHNQHRQPDARVVENERK